VSGADPEPPFGADEREPFDPEEPDPLEPEPDEDVADGELVEELMLEEVFVEPFVEVFVELFVELLVELFDVVLELVEPAGEVERLAEVLVVDDAALVLPPSLVPTSAGAHAPSARAVAIAAAAPTRPRLHRCPMSRASASRCRCPVALSGGDCTTSDARTAPTVVPRPAHSAPRAGRPAVGAPREGVSPRSGP
jgi:hypothetical protein